MNDKVTTILEVREKIKAFVAAREWDRFHNAKNLSMSIAAEAAELMECFLWLDGNQSSEAVNEPKGEDIRHEIADIAYMLLCLCNAHNIDLAAAIENKMVVNAERYPVEKAKGNTKKYTEF